jgi:cyclic beta-1,2-glucan synthetase
MNGRRKAATVGKSAAVLKSQFESWYSELINPLKSRSARIVMSEFLGSLSATFGKASSYADEQPVRAEIFSVERLEQYALTLAAEHKTVTKKGRAQLLPRLEDNGRKLVAAYRSLVEAIRNGRAISPAAEWLVDNFHIVEEQLREIRQDLPKS